MNIQSQVKPSTVHTKVSLYRGLYPFQSINTYPVNFTKNILFN